MPTNTPPPYFPQGQLSPPDPQALRKRRMMFYGCLAAAVLLAVASIAGAIYLVKRLF